jgi:hypothetical protein
MILRTTVFMGVINQQTSPEVGHIVLDLVLKKLQETRVFEMEGFSANFPLENVHYATEIGHISWSRNV